MKSILPIRYQSEAGHVIARDGIVIALFIRASHAKIADAVGSLYTKYEALVGGPEILQWVQVGEEMKALTSARRNRIKKLLTNHAAAQRPNDFIVVDGGCSEFEACAFHFEYHGNEIDTPEFPHLRDKSSSVEIWLPTDFPDTVGGMGPFAERVIDLAETVPFTSGYCSLAFNYDESVRRKVERAVTTGMAPRHPGLDLHLTYITAAGIGEAVRGAYWLTLIGPAVLKKLGLSANEMRAVLANPGITVRELARGIAIQAGDELRPGDVNMGDNLPLTRKVAALIEPVTYVQKSGAFGFVTDDVVDRFIEWQRRHLR